MLSRFCFKSFHSTAKMTARHTPSINLQPPVHRGLTELDRSLFSVEVPVLAARVPAALAAEFRNGKGKNSLFFLPRTQAVVADPESPEYRRVLLAEQDRSSPSLQQLLAETKFELVEHTLNFDYDYWGADEILQAILPEDLLDESPTAFTLVGHIAHLNLRDAYLPHRHLIGQVILDKNKKVVRTVVNKLDTIDNEFRNFRMEVLAGDHDFNVVTSESNCTFAFDFSAVYWNSRLQGEHGKLVDSFSEHDVVCDAFAGVGPFAIPAGKKGCAVMASDLNPASASALKENARLNKVENTVRTGNYDARDFIRKSVLDVWNEPFAPYSKPLSSKAKSKLARQATKAAQDPSSAPTPTFTPDPTPSLPPRRLVNHFVMNLPALAIEFLDAFKGLYRPLYELEGAWEAVEEAGEAALPMVHCYCFTKSPETAEEDILERASKALGMPITPQAKDYRLRFVRDVAPRKEMYCLEFRLSNEMV
ncbi:Met-10+ like-protein-domain-containing protein, partial [Leucosporidium creatinivorum]